MKELQPFVDLDDNFLAVSMFDSGASWQSWRAMERNKLIVGLSLGMFVVEARDRGGTLRSATGRGSRYGQWHTRKPARRQSEVTAATLSDVRGAPRERRRGRQIET